MTNSGRAGRIAATAMCLWGAVSVEGLMAQRPDASRYLVTWVADADGADSDFLAVLDVAPGSRTYGQVLTTVPVGERGTVPHHTEHELTPGRSLFANGFDGNRSFRFDVADPLHPKFLGPLAPTPGLAFPHTFVRLPNGNVLATMQASGAGFEPPGGITEYRDDGTPARWGSAANPVDPGTRPYSVLPLPEQDRLIVTGGRMFLPPTFGTPSELDHPGYTLQLWRLSDLRVLKTIALETPPGARAGIERNPYEVRRTSGGDILFSTGSGGLYRVTGTEPESFKAELVYDLGAGAYLPLVVDRFWIQAVASLRRVVVLDVSNAARPREISRIEFDDRQQPHWLGLDPLSNRIIVANSSAQSEARLWMLIFHPESGLLEFDRTFHDPGNDRPGIGFEREQWPHGRTGRGVPHGSVFAR